MKRTPKKTKATKRKAPPPARKKGRSKTAKKAGKPPKKRAKKAGKPPKKRAKRAKRPPGIRLNIPPYWAAYLEKYLETQNQAEAARAAAASRGRSYANAATAASVGHRMGQRIAKDPRTQHAFYAALARAGVTLDVVADKLHKLMGATKVSRLVVDKEISEFTDPDGSLQLRAVITASRFAGLGSQPAGDQDDPHGDVANDEIDTVIQQLEAEVQD